jgi:hypothetical protein
VQKYRPFLSLIENELKIYGDQRSPDAFEKPT